VLTTSILGLLAWAISFYGMTAVKFQFVVYLVCTILTSRLKVGLPGVAGTVSVNYLFILISVIELNLLQTMAIACTGTLAQCLLNSKVRPRRVQLIFNFYNASFCAWGSYLVFHSRLVPLLDDSLTFRLFLTATAYFLINTGSISMIISLTEKTNVYRTWHENFFWTSPHYLLGAAMAGLIHYCNQQFGWQYVLFLMPGAYLIYRSYEMYLGRLEKEKRHVSEEASLHLRTIEALSLAIEAKDQSSHGHLRRVQVFAREIAKELGLSQEEIRAVEAGALLHDIGKLAVPEYILSKPGRLTPEEFERIKIHPVVGAEILSWVSFPYPVVPIVRAHHEKWDGTGYPDGLKGEEIPIGARILSVVDCLDALASDRMYRQALPLEEAMARVKLEAGFSFDPTIVDLLELRCAALEQLFRSTPLHPMKLPVQPTQEPGEEPEAGHGPAEEAESAQTAPAAEFVSSISAAREEFQLLHEITRDLGSSLSVEDTCTLLAARLKKLVPYDAIAIYGVAGGKLVPQFTSGEDAAHFASLEIPLGAGLSGWVAENVKPILNGNPSVESGYLHSPSVFSVLRSAASVPLEGMSGVVGALTLYHRKPEAFTRDQLRILQAVSSKTGLTIENARQFRQAQTSAASDPLTGLPNIHKLYRYLEGEVANSKSRPGTPLALAVIDLDGFKQVNDRFGHLVGNRVLMEIAKGLTKTCRQNDFAARLGGDEFVVILPGGSLQAMNDRIGLIAQSVDEASQSVCGERIVGASIGTACYPDDGETAEDLLDVADRRMYKVKLSRRDSEGLRTLEERVSERNSVFIP
jgi:diguanylate cyclase (GGDEF)-like protein/putative nucleotidyltransferase with HDIG domain